MEEGESGRLVIRIERRGVRRYACGGCCRRTSTARQALWAWSDRVDGL